MCLDIRFFFDIFEVGDLIYKGVNDMQSYFLKLDWLGFTYRSDDRNRLPIDNFVADFPEFRKIVLEEAEISSIRSNYNVTLSWENDILFAYNVFHDNDTPGQVANTFNVGVNVQVPSHSLPLFFKLFGFDFNDDMIIPKMFSLLKSRHCQLSRLDLCFDDFNYRKTYTAKDYARFFYQNRIQTPFTITTMGTDRSGYTTYFGSLSKRTKLLRIYDKFKESEGYVDSVRYEFELHSDDARNMCDFIIDVCPHGIEFSKLIYSFLKVKVPNASSYSKIANAPDDEEWCTFLMCGFKTYDEYKVALKNNSDESNKFADLNLDLTLSSQASIMPYKIPNQDIFKRKKDLTHFVHHQCIPSLAGYVECYGEEELLSLIRRAINEGRIKEEYKRERTKLLHCPEWLKVLPSADNPFVEY